MQKLVEKFTDDRESLYTKVIYIFYITQLIFNILAVRKQDTKSRMTSPA